jgi:hypothetical protein
MPPINSANPWLVNCTQPSSDVSQCSRPCSMPRAQTISCCYQEGVFMRSLLESAKIDDRNVGPLQLADTRAARPSRLRRISVAPVARHGSCGDRAPQCAENICHSTCRLNLGYDGRRYCASIPVEELAELFNLLRRDMILVGRGRQLSVKSLSAAYINFAGRTSNPKVPVYEKRPRQDHRFESTLARTPVCRESSIGSF